MKILIPVSFNLKKEDIDALMQMELGEYSIQTNVIEKLERLNLIKRIEDLVLTPSGKLIVKNIKLLSLSNLKTNLDFAHSELKRYPVLNGSKLLN
jgi:hypothetical protein